MDNELGSHHKRMMFINEIAAKTKSSKGRDDLKRENLRHVKGNCRSKLPQLFGALVVSLFGRMPCNINRSIEDEVHRRMSSKTSSTSNDSC